MKLIKYVLIGLGAIIALFIVVAVLFVATFDPNQYKDTIVSVVKQATGRELTIDGDIGFSFFPHLGVRTGTVQLSNAPGFPGDAFAGIEYVQVNVDLLSILKGEVAADRIVIKGLTLNLVKNKKGHTNWEDLSSASGSASSSAASGGNQNAALLSGIHIAGISIEDSKLNYRDEQAGSSIQVEPLNLETGPIANQTATPVKLNVGVTQENPRMTVTVDMNTSVLPDLTTLTFALENLDLVVNGQGDSFPGGVLAAELKGNMRVDTKKEQVQLAPMQLKAVGMEFDGDLKVDSFANPAISFTLNTDQLNLDKLLPADEKTSASSNSQSSDAESADTPIELPTDALKSLNLNGSLSIGQLIVSGLEMSDVSAKLQARNGKLAVNPLLLSMYEGKFSGQASLDVNKAKPVYASKSELTGIEISKLMAALSEDGKAVIRGKSNLAFDVVTNGDRVSQLKKQLKGDASFKATDGALVNAKLAHNVERVVAFLKGREPKASGEELVFDSFTATTKILNGVAHNDDLNLKTPLIFGTGEGDIDIGESKMDYALKVSLAEDAKRSIPIRMKGPFDDLSYSVDLKAALSEKQKEIVEEKKEEIKEKVDEKIKDKLGDKLKNLKLF